MTKVVPGKHSLTIVLVRVLVFILVSSATLHAQRKNVLGTTGDFVGGVDDNPRTSSLPFQDQKIEPFFGLYPSLTLESLGAHSSFNLDYAFGWQRTQGTRKFDSRTHSVNAGLTNHFSPRWSTTINNSFSMSDDVQTFYALRGVLPTPEGATFFFSPVANEVTSTSNRVSGSIDYSFSQRSALAFSGSYSLRNYPGNVGGLSDQQDGGAGVTYTHRKSEHTSWNFGYTRSFYQFAEFDDATSNAARVGMATEFAKDTSFTWSVGGSQVRSRQNSEDFAGYEVSAGLNRKIKDNFFQLSVSQDNSPNGLGSLSQNRRAGLGFSRLFGRRTNLFASMSFFDSKGILDNPFDTRGSSAAANVGFALNRKLSLQVGAQYQRYTEPVTYRFTQKRLFVSLRYTNPNLWRSH